MMFTVKFLRSVQELILTLGSPLCRQTCGRRQLSKFSNSLGFCDGRGGGMEAGL